MEWRQAGIRGDGANGNSVHCAYPVCKGQDREIGTSLEWRKKFKGNHDCLVLCMLHTYNEGHETKEGGTESGGGGKREGGEREKVGVRVIERVS